MELLTFTNPLIKQKSLNQNTSGNVTVHLKSPKKRRQHNASINQHQRKKNQQRKKKQNQQPQQKQHAAAKAAKSQKRNARKNTKKKKASMQCTKLKATKFLGHVQLANGVDQDTSWEITMTGTLADTAALHATSRSKLSSFKSSNSNYSF